MFLEKIHSYSKTWFFKLLLGAICASFVIFGLTDMITRFINDRPLAKIGSLTIKPEELSRHINQETNRLMQLSKEKLDLSTLRQMGLHQMVLDRLINDRAITQLHQQLHLNVSESMIKQAIQSIPAFQKDGVYDGNLASAILRNQGINEVAFAEEIKHMLFSQQLNETLAGSLSIPGIYTNVLVNALSQSAIYHAVTIPVKSIKLDEPVTEDNLKLYYTNHQDKYRLPEYRTIDYVVFDESKLSKNVVIDDAAIQERYEQSKLDFTSAETRLVVKLTCPSAKAAADAKEMLKTTSMKKVAKAIKGAVYDDIGLVEKDTLPENVSTAIFAAAKGSYTDVINSGSLYTIYHVTTIHPATTKTLAEVKGTITEALQREKYMETFQQTRDAFEDALAGGQTLPETAQHFKIHAISTSEFDRTGHSKSKADAFASLPDDVKIAIIEQAFQQTDGSECRVIDVSSQYSIAVRLKTVTAAMVPSFEVTKAKVMADYEMEKKKEKGFKLAAQIAKTSKTLAHFNDALKSNHFGHSTKYQASRLDFEAKNFAESHEGKFFKTLQPATMKKIFSTSIGECIYGETHDESIVVLFHEKDESKKIEPTMNKTLVTNINTLAARDIGALLANAARTRIDIMINHEIVQQMTRALNDGD